MKKRIFSIIALLLVCVFSLYACDGCSSLPELTFNNAFNGGTGLSEQDPQPYFCETLEYDVSYAETFESSKIDDNLKKNENVSFEFSNGRYTSTLRVYKSFMEANKDIKSDIIDSLKENESLAFHLNTEFSIYAKYTIGEKVTDNAEKIVSDVYFCKTSLGFAPVYATTKATYLQFYYSIGEVIKVEAESETTYQQKSYTIKQKITGNKASEETESENKYSYKTIIDNTQLLFALRNIEVELEKITSLPVLAPAYKTPETLAINYTKDTSISYTEDNPLYYGSDRIEGNISAKHYRFYRNDAKATGAVQHVYIQNKVENTEDGLIEYRALPIRYVETLTTFGNFVPMGVLVYTLDRVTISN